MESPLGSRSPGCAVRRVVGVASLASACAILAFIPCAESSLAAQQVPSARVVPLPVALDLGPIRWALPLPGERVIFADDGSKLVYVRQVDGSTTQLGRRGDGPGEYRAPENGVLKGDSILIFAAGLSQRTALHLQTGTGTTRRMLGTSPDATCRPLILITSEGVCERPKLGDPRAADHYRTYLRFTTEGAGERLTPLYRSYDTAYVARLVKGTTTRHLVRPIVWGAIGAVSAGGTLALVLEQDLAGATVEVVVTVTELTNGRRTVHRLTGKPTVVSAAAVRAEARRRVRELAALGSPAVANEADAVSEMVVAWGAPRSAPPFRHIYGSDDGCFWLERSRILGDALPASSVYDRYDRVGRPLGSVSVPLEVFLHSVTCAEAIGARTDDDGVPELVRVEVLR